MGGNNHSSSLLFLLLRLARSNRTGHFFGAAVVLYFSDAWADRGLFPVSTLQASPKNRNGGFSGRLRRLRLVRGRQGPRPECPTHWKKYHPPSAPHIACFTHWKKYHLPSDNSVYPNTRKAPSFRAGMDSAADVVGRKCRMWFCF